MFSCPIVSDSVAPQTSACQASLSFTISQSLFKLMSIELVTPPNHVVLCCSVPKSCPTLCDPMDYSTPGFSVLHSLLEFTQTHVHRVGDVIQPSHPLLSPSPLAFNLFQHQGLSNESVLRIRWPKYWSFSFSITPSNEYSGLISCRMDWLNLLESKGLSKVFSNTTVQKHQLFGAQLSL